MTIAEASDSVLVGSRTAGQLEWSSYTSRNNVQSAGGKTNDGQEQPDTDTDRRGD